MSIVEVAAAIGVVVGCAVALLTLGEKITGIGQRWLARGVEAGVRSLREDINDLRADQLETTESLADHKRYTRYHLGPNGDSIPVHARIAEVERVVKEDRP